MKNICRKAFESEQIIEKLGSYATNDPATGEDEAAIRDLSAKLEQNLEFLNDKRAVRLVKKRQTKKTKSNKASTNSYYDSELVSLLNSIKVTTDLSKQERNSAPRSDEGLHKETDKKLRDLDELAEMARTLGKYLLIKQQHFNSQISSPIEQESLACRLAEEHELLNSLVETIDSRRQIYEQEKRDMLISEYGSYLMVAMATLI